MKRTDWETPPNLFKWLHKRFDFTLDAAASKKNALLPDYLTEEDNTLSYEFDRKERIFCNPPYDQDKEFAEHLFSQFELFGTQSVLLLPVRCDRVWWNRLRVSEGVRIEFYTGRIHFGGSNNGAFMYNCNFIFGFPKVPLVDPIDAGMFNKDFRGRAKR